MIMKKYFFAVILAVILPGLACGAIPAEERAALIALYNATNGDNWTQNNGWKGTNNEADGFSQAGTEGAWYGITVENDSVTQINQGENNLSGSIPPELEKLSNLQYLNFKNNTLSGVIPVELGNLTHLKNLHLSGNDLSGTIPTELGNLENLESLRIRYNNLSGSIPPELGNLQKLQSIFLEDNSLSGNIPAELGNLENLKFLSLYSNNLSGTIPPELGNLSRLVALHLYWNNLSGEIPSSLGKLENLLHLYLFENNFSGSIPAELGNLGSAIHILLDHNNLSGTIPPELGNLAQLELLQLNKNELSGEIPPELGNLSKLQSLDLSFNHLSGNIPSQLGDLKKLEALWLNSNKLSGGIPPGLAGLSLLSGINIGYNALYTDHAGLRTFLDLKTPNWAKTQTIAPEILYVSPRSNTSVEISWNPIVYTSDSGGYKVSYSTAAGGPWTKAGSTTDKNASQYEVTGLNYDTTYYFVVQTRTDSHSHNNNTVFSDFSNEMAAAPSMTPLISLSRTQFYFGSTVSGSPPPSQEFTVTNGGVGILHWTAAGDKGWLNVSPAAGTGSGNVSISIDPAGLSAGTYNGIVTISDPNAVNSPGVVPVQLIVKNASQDQVPLGSFDTPLNGAVVSGSIPVTGWAVDDTGIENVKIYRELAAGESGSLIYIGDAIFVQGARPDIEQAYPDYPMSYKAGWGYMMLTNFLPDKGNGTFTLHAVASDAGGNRQTLGTKTIFCNNADAIKPFGAMDSPEQGGTVSGSSYVNFGWALTAQPNVIPTDGSTINVWIDGANAGHPVYNIYRGDIAALFPGYANSDGAVGYIYIDTTRYRDGIHTISWSVTDNAGHTDGIGSRYFTVQNLAGDMGQGAQNTSKTFSEIPVPVDVSSAVKIKKGYNQKIPSSYIYPGDKGITTIRIKELERLEVKFSHRTLNLCPLPIGSTLDPGRGIFYWQPGPGFIGDYHLVFAEDQDGKIKKKILNISISPKFEKEK